MVAQIEISPEEFKYLAIQRGKISAFVSQPVDWLLAYHESLKRDFESMQWWLPTTCSAVLDVGSGLGGINILFNRHYNGVRVELLDGEADPPVMKLHRKTFNNMVVAREFLRKNGITDVVTHDANDPAKRNDLRKVDLVISLGSWCFHYPPELYLDFVHSKCHSKTVLIVDMRLEKPNYTRAMHKYFDEVATIIRSKKFWRTVYRVRGNR